MIALHVGAHVQPDIKVHSVLCQTLEKKGRQPCSPLLCDYNIRKQAPRYLLSNFYYLSKLLVPESSYSLYILQLPDAHLGVIPVSCEVRRIPFCGERNF